MSESLPEPSSSTASAPRATEAASTASSNSRQYVRLQKKAALLRDLLRTLDILVYIQLAAIYYLDTLTILFMIRNVSQRALSLPSGALLRNQTNARYPTFVHATLARYRARYGGEALGSTPTSTSDAFTKDLARHTNQQLAVLLGISLLSILLHLFLSPPTAGEVSRGYLHGGLLIDVVGQKAAGPILSRLRVLALDGVVACLQIVAVCVSAENQRAEYACSSKAAPERSTEEMAQFDALIEQIMRNMTLPEERNRLTRAARRRRSASEAQDGVELRTLNSDGREDQTSSGEAPQEVRGNEESRLLDMAQPGRDVEDEIEDLESGQAVIMTIDVIGALKNTFWELKHRRRGEV